MIHEHHQHIPEEYKVSAPTVAPWTRFPVCPKCAHTVGAGIFLLALWHSSQGECAQNFIYCPGDHNSTVQAANINPFTGEVKPTEIKIPCFGVFTEHLHLGCGRCKFTWLMACKGGK